VRALVRAALAGERRRPAEIGVVLIDDDALRALNRRWRRLDRATDVLSFGYDEARAARIGSAVSGDIVISLDRMRAQAHRYRVTPGNELARLVVHGALHLAGLDHKTAVERRRMRARESRALRSARAAVASLDRALRR
jgi:probable rRNA maturation factor